MPPGSPLEPSAAVRAMLQSDRPPLIGLLARLRDWIDERHLALLDSDGFDDVRRAHNAVFVHLRAGGMRLTELADAADMSKQAMAELVDDLVAKDYLEKRPDPTDGRAKLIHWAERGMSAHEATMEAFAAIEIELAAIVGEDEIDRLRSTLLQLVAHLQRG